MTMARNLRGVAAAILSNPFAMLLFGLSVACGGQGATASALAGDDAGADTAVLCDPGATRPCDCLNRASGTQACGADGVYGSCACGTTDAAPPIVTCGDAVCSGDETCKTCPNDCGECPACGFAPSCSNALAIPSQPTNVDYDSLGTPAPPPTSDAGVPLANTCQDAQLRLRIASIEVGHQGKEVWLPTGTISGPPQSYYCLMQASDGAVLSGAGDDAGTGGTVEVALTKPTATIPDFGSADFGPADSLFWGQMGPRLTQGNLTITYSCFQQKDPSSNTFSNVLNAAAMAAGNLANAGPYGWAFGLGSIALQAAGAAVQAAQQQGDWHMFDVTQTIDESRLLDLTNGRTWSFTRGGGDAAFQYPWSLTVHVESWGCADPRPTGAR
jgi:hypothetical protein